MDKTQHSSRIGTAHIKRLIDCNNREQKFINEEKICFKSYQLSLDSLSCHSKGVVSDRKGQFRGFVKSSGMFPDRGERMR
jgi:hypothetical protein